MKKFGSIYIVRSTKTPKVYIGQTVQPMAQRRSQHKCKLSETPFSRAIQKYGFDTFTFEEIYVAFSQEELDKREIELIKEYNCMIPNGYNIQSGGKDNYDYSKLHRVKSNSFTKTKEEKVEMSKKKRQGKWDYIVATNIKTKETIKLDTVNSSKEYGFNPKNVSRIINQNPNYTHKGYTFQAMSYGNPSGSLEIKDSKHAQRLPVEPIHFRTKVKTLGIICNETQKTYYSRQEVINDGYSWECVRYVLHGRNKTHKNQTFKFIE